MDDRLTELDVRELVERMASGDPVPGGGSAAGLAGAMGAALIHMVVELTPADEHAEALTQIGIAATTWQSELLNLAELDANAYDAVVRARRLPRETEPERRARNAQVAAATREATRVPLQVARAAAAVVELAERLAPVGNRHAISDVGVAALLAATSLRGAALNVRINLPHLDDDALRDEATATLEELLAGLPAREKAVADGVEERMG